VRSRYRDQSDRVRHRDQSDTEIAAATKWCLPLLQKDSERV